MNKYPIIYPILFALNPILLPLSANISDISINEAFPLIIILPIIAISLMALGKKVLKDPNRSGYITFILFIWFFHYNNFKDIIISYLESGTPPNIHLILFPIWTILFIFLISHIIWRRISNPNRLTLLLNLAIGTIVLFSIVRIGIDLIPRYRHPSYITKNIFNDIDHSPDKLPDIYYIILDGYANNQILDEIYKYDNSEFINNLKKFGFQIAGGSTSNYMQTAISLASSLNFEYLTELPTTAPDRGQLIGLIKNSRTRHFLEKYGYQIIAFSTPYLATDITNADIYLKSQENQKIRNNIQSLMLINSIAIIAIENKWISIPIMRFKEQQINIDFTINNIPETTNIRGPKFVFAHIIAPHPPFIFDHNGPINPDQYYILMDGNKFNIPTQEYFHGYTQQISFINSLIIEAIENLLKNAENRPIIIIQADHGPGAYLNFDDESRTCHRERFSILNAYFLPDSNIIIPQDITPVNSFRIIFNNYFDQNLPILDNKSFYSSWSNPYQFTEVTDKLISTCGD